jgi:hypothetical protein
LNAIGSARNVIGVAWNAFGVAGDVFGATKQAIKVNQIGFNVT